MSAGGWRSLLNRSPSSAGEIVGALNARRIEVRPFTPAQIKLLETFADQAVIAIENVRLFKNSRSRWSSKLRRVKSWASSLARRLISSRCLMWSQKMQRVCAMLWTPQFIASMGNAYSRLRIADQCQLGELTGR